MNTSNHASLQTPEATVHRLYAEFLNEGNTATADELISPDFTGPAGKGPDAFKSTVLPLRQAFPDLRFIIQDTVVEGSRVVVRWTWQATHRGLFAGIAPTGRVVTNEGIAIYRLEDGEIAEAWAQMDRLGVLQQLGGVPPQGQARPVPPAEISTPA